MDTILLDNLSKTYPGGKQALTGISLSLGEGEVFGFLGPNGAGNYHCETPYRDSFSHPGTLPGHGNRSFQGAGKDPCKNRSGH